MTFYPYKRPIRHLQRYFIKYDREHTLETIANQFPNIEKWVNDDNVST